MTVAYLALGSNQGERRRQLREAAHAVAALPETRVTGVSSLYETEFQGPGRQDDYLNACLRLETDLAPGALLRLTQDLEREAGRAAAGHMQPRPLDVDMLLHGDQIIDRPELTLPHPRMAQRRFVLQPLAELAPRLRPPGCSHSVQEMLAQAFVQGQALRRIDDAGWWVEVSVR